MTPLQDARRFKIIYSPMPFFQTIVRCATIKSRREYQLDLFTKKRKYTKFKK